LREGFSNCIVVVVVYCKLGSCSIVRLRGVEEEGRDTETCGFASLLVCSLSCVIGFSALSTIAQVNYGDLVKLPHLVNMAITVIIFLQAKHKELLFC